MFITARQKYSLYDPIFSCQNSPSKVSFKFANKKESLSLLLVVIGHCCHFKLLVSVDCFCCCSDYGAVRKIIQVRHAMCFALLLQHELFCSGSCCCFVANLPVACS